MNNIVTLESISSHEKVRIRLDKTFLQNLFIKASGKEKPHCDIDFIKILGMKPTIKDRNTTIYGWMQKEIPINVITIKKVAELANVSWLEIENNTLWIKSGEAGVQIKNIFPLKLDKRIGSIVGHILGDGSIDKKYQQVFFSNSEKEILREFAENMKKVFDLDPRIWMQKEPKYGNTQWDRRLSSIDELEEGRNGGLFYPTICGLILNKIFDNFAVGKEKKMTNKILGSNLEFKGALIRAFYDDEATVTNKSIRVFQNRSDILEVFRALLLEIGISSTRIKTYMKRDKERYYFDIFRKSNLKIFHKSIGFTSPKKRQKLELIVNKAPHWNDK